MSSSILKYGQVIRIRSNDRLNAFITSKSYTDPSLYFQIYDSQQKILENNNELININNYRQSLFEVLPTASFEINDQMNFMKNQIKKLQSLPRAKTQQQQFKAIIAQKRGRVILFGDKVVFKHLDSHYYIHGLFDSALSGIGAFKIQLRKQLSERIIFQLISYRTYQKIGDEISINAPFRIFHCQTQCYVSYCFENIFIDGNYKQNYKRSYSINTKINDNIFVPVILPSIKTAQYNQDYKQTQQINDGTSNLTITMPITGRFLIINQNIPKKVFKIVPHNQFEMKINRLNINNHDIVYFIHTKDDKYLCPNNFHQGINLIKRKNQIDFRNIFNGLWEIQEVKIIDEKIGENQTTNKIKSPTKKKNVSWNNNQLGQTFLAATLSPNIIGGAIGVGLMSSTGDQQDIQKNKKKKKYLMRHLVSGRLMFISDDQNNVQIEQYKKQILKKPILLECQDSNLTDGALVNFTYKRYHEGKIIKYYLDTKHKKKNKNKIQHFIANQQQDQSSAKSSFLQEDLDQIQLTYQQFFLKEQLEMTIDSSQHGFRVHKIDEKVKQLALYVMSSQEIIYKFSQLIGNFHNVQELLNSLNVLLLNNVINVFKELIGFIYDCQYIKIAQSGNSPNVRKQRIFDQLGMIQIVTHMLEDIHNSERPQKLMIILNPPYLKSSQYKKIRLIYVLGYQLLQSIAANNYQMKIKMSKYLQKYLSHIYKPLNKVVYRSLQQVLDGNYLALQKKVSQNYIKQLIQSIDIKNPDPADLYFLSRLCICKDRTILKNQNAIYHYFYSDQQFKHNFQEEKVAENKFKFRQDQNKMQILSKISATLPTNYRTLTEMYQQCQMAQMEGFIDPKKGHWNYFMQYLNLMADICVHQNTTPLRFIFDTLPLKTLVAFLYEPIVKNFLLYQPFIRLIHYAFVQTRDFEEINRITKVKQWNQLGDFNIPKTIKRIQPQLEKTKQLIMDFLRRINLKNWNQQKLSNDKQPQTINFNLEDKDRLISIKTFLEIMKSTLNLGFWSTMFEMKKMLPYMFRILRFDIEYADKKLGFSSKINKNDDNNNNNNEYHLTDKQTQQKQYCSIKQQLTLNKPNIVLLVECKILASQIINIIIDYMQNVNVSMITKHFKDVMQMDVDLSKYQYDKLKFMNRWKNNYDFQLINPNNQKQGYLLNQNLWIDKVNQMLNINNIFQQCFNQNINYSLVLFQTFIYSNQQLTNLVLLIIHRITNMRHQILKTFKDIILVAGGNLSKLADRGVKVTRSVLLHLTNINIRQCRIFIAPNPLLVKFRDKSPLLFEDQSLGAIQQLAFLTMAMIKNANPTLSRASKFYGDTQLYPFIDISNIKQQYLNNNGLSKDGSYLIINEKDENLQLNQNLIKSQDHHVLIIDFIKIMQDIPIETLPIRALHAAYNFITVLVWNHNQNKKQLQSILKISQCHLNINVGCIDFFKEMYKNNKKLVIKNDVTRIVSTIIDYTNSSDMKLYLKSKLMDFLRLIIIFDNCGVERNQNIVMQIISQIQVSNNNQIVYLNTNDILSNRIKQNYWQWIQDYQIEYSNNLTNYEIINVSAQLFYIATFFEIFCSLIENQNVVNIGKCTNMHPLIFLLDILNKSAHCWPVIRHLRAYVNKLYYFQNRQKDSSLFDIFIQFDFVNLKKQLRGIVQIICNTPHYNIIKIKYPIRYTFLGSYIFLCLQEILNTLDLVFTNKLFIKHIFMQLNQAQTKQICLHHIIFELIEMIEYLLKNIEGRQINKYLTKVSKKLKNTVSNTPINIVEKFNQISKKETTDNQKKYGDNTDDVPFRKNYLFHGEKGLWRHLIDWNAFKDQEINRQKTLNNVMKGQSKDPTDSKQAQQQKKRDYLLEYIYLGNIEKKIKKITAKNPKRKQEQETIRVQDITLSETNLPTNLTTSLSNRFTVKNQRFQNSEIKNNIINIRRKKLVKFIEINQQFIKFCQKERKQKLYDIFDNLDNLSRNQYNGIVVVGNAQVIKSIVKMNEINPHSIQFDYKLLIIKTLTNYILSQCTNFNQNLLSSFLSEDIKNVRKAQNFLNQCGCPSFLCSLIIYNTHTTIQMDNSILLFAFALLFGQNYKTQNAIFNIFKNDIQNVHLTEIGTLIKTSGLVITNHSLKNSQKQFHNPNPNYSDTYDYYNDIEKIMIRKFIYIPQTLQEQKQFQDKLIQLQRIFTFLKVLCQGNNEIKNFIRQQTTNDQQAQVKQQSINFISLGVSQLKKMFTNFNLNIVKVPFAIVDFINQVTQIPCIFNQLFLCQSSFFHDFASLSMMIEQQINDKKIIMNYQNVLIINKLFSKNIGNVISCLQGNQNEIYQFLSNDDLLKYFIHTLSFFLQYLSTLENILEPINNPQKLKTILSHNSLHLTYFYDLFQVTSVIMKLKLKTNLSFQKRTDYYLQKSNMYLYFELLENNLLGIEVAMDNGGGNQILFFPRHTVFNYLSRTTRCVIMQQINRSTQRDKIIGLFNTKVQISQEINYNYYLDNQFTLLNIPFSVSNSKIIFLQKLGLYISTLICFLMLIFSNVIHYHQQSLVQYDLGSQTKFIKLLAYFQFSIAMIFYLLWVKNHLHLAIQKFNYQRQQLVQKGQNQSSIMKYILKLSILRNIYCLMFYQKQFSGVLLFMIGSTLGTFFKMQWFSILLINLMMSQMDVLKNIFNAITINIKMLSMLSLLGITFIAIFSIFSLSYYSRSLYPQKIPKQHCQSVLDCIIQLYIRQEIGKNMDSFQTGRFIYDMLYTIFMDTLFGNIVGGVLIDTIAQLRDQRNQIQQDTKGMCFICGVSRQTLEKKNEDLRTHYKYRYHKLWNYVFYLYYLQKQKHKTGLELIIYDKFKTQDVSWIPTQAGYQTDITDQIQDLQKQIKNQTQYVKSIIIE